VSGGHWGYQSWKIRDAMLDEGEFAKLRAIIEAVAETEHIVDWAICGDTTREDAEPKLFDLWVKTFDRIFE
jgi:membrane glycosyltransferase